MFIGNNSTDNFGTFLQKYKLQDVQKEYPIAIEEIYKTLNNNFSLSVVNVGIRQNFIIIDLLNKINSNMEKIINNQ